MGNLKKIPMLRACVIQPFISLSQQIGIPTEKHLRSTGLPPELENDPELILPEIPCWHFVEQVSKVEGIEHLGVLAGNAVSHQDIAAMLSLFQDCSNLYQILNRFCEMGPFFSNNNVYALEERGDSLRFVQKGTRFIKQAMQVELFEILGMIQIVQLTAGNSWRPTDVDFTFPYQKNIENMSELNPSRFHFSQPFPSISFPRHLLMQPFSATEELSTFNNKTDASMTALPESFSGGVLKIVLPYLGKKKFTISTVAEIVGLTQRTFQRRLASEQTNFSQLCDDARMMQATALLKERSLKLIDVTYMLGFENPSSFSRAFKRWSGLSPKEYRQHYFCTKH